jgi:hypothetical protein
MTIQNSSTDTTANAAGIPTTYAEDNKDMVIEDITDIEKGGADSHFVQQQAAAAQDPPQSSGCNSR